MIKDQGILFRVRLAWQIINGQCRYDRTSSTLAVDQGPLCHNVLTSGIAGLIRGRVDYSGLQR